MGKQQLQEDWAWGERGRQPGHTEKGVICVQMHPGSLTSVLQLSLLQKNDYENAYCSPFRRRYIAKD